MYLAQHKVENELHFIIRQSYWDGSSWQSRDLIDLGPDPAVNISYEGRRGFHLSEGLEEALAMSGITPKPYELEFVFSPFLPAHLQHRLEGLYRTASKSSPAGLSYEEEKRLCLQIHQFDMRRFHYLRHGNLDLSRISTVPIRYFRRLADKSRDELEQTFLLQEIRLPTSEYKAYVYASLNLQRFFSSPDARRYPQHLDQERLGVLAVEELAALNRDPHFWMCQPPAEGGLHEYLLRYQSMFFNYEFGQDTAEQDYIRNFINSHRRQQRPHSVQANAVELENLFGMRLEELAKLSRRQLRRLYKKCALKLHPDKDGGDHESFIRMTRIYEGLLRKARR